MKGNPSPISDRKLAGLFAHLGKEESFVFLETTRVDAENHLSYLFLDRVEQLTCLATENPRQFLEKLQGYLDDGYYLAGSFSYEFGYLLEESLVEAGNYPEQVVASMGVYGQPFVYDHHLADFVDRHPWPQWEGPGDRFEESYQVNGLAFSQSKEEYLANIARVKRYIESGDTYQVNYTLKLLFEFQGSDTALYRALRRNQSVSYGAFIKDGSRRTLSFSPELFFRKRGRECLVKPMKGTSRRAPGLIEDRLIREHLAGDGKNRSENIMIVDLLRNDLGRLSLMGQVETLSLFDVETYETLHQMTSSIKGKLRSDVGLVALFTALFPCGSVTGAPKIRTMEIIRELEGSARGVYTGAIGFISPSGDAVFNVPIRTVTLDGEHGEMGIGSGIVYDSDPQQEWDECCLKGKFLQASLPEFQLIETILFHHRQGYWLLARHLARLGNSADYWGFSFAEEGIVKALNKVVATCQGGEHYRVRLLLNKDGGLEINAVPCGGPQESLGSEDPVLPAVVLSPTPTLAADPFLHHKTTCRSLYDAERDKAMAAGFFEVIFANERGELTEGSVTNIFLRKDGKLLTPPLGCGVLGGVLREALLAGEVGAPAGLQVVEEVLTVSDLSSSEAIYVGNSVRGLIRVRFVADGSG